MDRLRKSRSVDKCVWQDEKNFILDVRLNSQNSRVCMDLKIKIILKIINFSITPIDSRKR